MTVPAHDPVLLPEVVAAIGPVDGAIIVDGTFGAGGYSRAFLAAADCRVFAIDRDLSAIRTAEQMVAEFPGRITPVPGRFGEMDLLLAARGVSAVDGIALDIGVSSMQLDQPDRGFSFRSDGPLDMRMGEEGPTAADVVNGESEADLANIIYEFGEERRSRQIARAIVAARREAPITRTLQLAAIVAPYAERSPGVNPATKTFQALRIYVNDELGELGRGLRAAERLLRPAGRLAVVSFHSLEDRLVKRFLDKRSGRAAAPSRHLPPAEQASKAPSFTMPKRGLIRPAEGEVARNPRARSARLRVAERTAAPAWAEAA